MTVLISKEIEFDAGHRVMTHGSKCRSPHGHRYKVQVEISGPVDEDESSTTFGMITDFGTLKEMLTELIHDPLDHAMIIYKGDRPLLTAMSATYYGGYGEAPWKTYVFPYMPTAENIARWCWEQMDKNIDKELFHLTMVTVWETPTSIARYIGEQ